MALFLQYLAVCGLIEQDIVRAFREGGGVPYEKYDRFQELQRAESAAIYDAALLDTIVPLVPGLPDRLRAGNDVADIGCGAGHAINLLAREFPASHFTGFDYSDEGLALARAEVSAWGITNVDFVARDVANLDTVQAYDVITAFDSIHDQARPRDVLRNIARALRPGGVFLMVDIAASSELDENMDHPIAPLLYSASTFHCMAVSLGQGGEGLGNMWGEQKARQLLAEAGFTSVNVARVDGDIQNNYYVCRLG